MTDLRILERPDGTRRLQSRVRGVWTDAPVVQDDSPPGPEQAAQMMLEQRLVIEELRAALAAKDEAPDGS